MNDIYALVLCGRITEEEGRLLIAARKAAECQVEEKAEAEAAALNRGPRKMRKVFAL